MGDIVPIIIGYLARTAVLTLLLWIMIRVQKLNYFFLGVLGSAALACAFDTIPYVGHYLAVPALYFCIWKVTQSTLYPDAVFTVVVSYALMFLVNILLTTALMGDFHATAAEVDEPEPGPTVTIDTSASPVTTTTQAANKTRTDGSINSTPRKPASAWLKDFTLKGVTENGNKSMLTIAADKKTYTLTVGKLTSVQTADGPCQMQLAQVTNSMATIEINGEPYYLHVH